MAEKQIIHAQNRLICVICHSCEEHFPIRLADFVLIMSESKQDFEEAIGWVCGECQGEDNVKTH